MCGCIGVLDREGNARKVVNCSCVVVRDWGEESQERSILLNYFQTEQQSDGVLDNVIRGIGLWRTAYTAAQRIRYRKARSTGWKANLLQSGCPLIVLYSSSKNITDMKSIEIDRY